MKKMYTLLLSIICMYQLHAQYTTIPDAVFEQFLINQGIDSEGTLDGQVLTSDVAMVYSLDIPYTISDITGIQDFTALTYLKTANITALDVSGLTVLQELDLSINTGLQTLNVTGCTGLRNLNIKLTSLDTLDLSTCTSLETIDMYKCTIQDLDVSGLTSLISISANESYLRTLNVTGCTALSGINVSETGVRNLDLSDKSALINFSAFDSALEDINFTNCINLERIVLRWNDRLNSINLANCNKINTIWSDYNLTLLNFDTSSLVDIESLYLDGVSVNQIDLSNSTNLTSIYFNYCTIGSLDLRNGNNTNITSFTMNSVDLDCISVDDEVYSTANWDISGNSNFIFSNDCQTLSTTENQMNSISIYPNPVVNNLNIGLQNHQILQEVTLVNLQGKKMLTSTSNTIDLSNLSSGYYFAMIHTNQGKSIKKILKK